jgi:hypothetical protein
MAQLYPQALGSFFVAFYDSQGYGGGIRTRHHTGFKFTNSKSKSKFLTTDGQSASLSWNKASIWGLRPDLYYCLTIAGLLMWGALSDERTGLSFIRVTVSSSKSVVSMYNLHFTCYWMYVYMYIQYVQGLGQSRLSTGDHALLLVAPATTAV